MTQHSTRHELPIYRICAYRVAVTTSTAYSEGLVTYKNHQNARPVIVFADGVLRVSPTIR